MKYLCVGYFEPAKMDALSKAQVDAVMSKCPHHMEELHQTGQLLTVAGVDVEARYLRRAYGQVQISDRPGKESQEMIGCVYIIEARDMADAIRVASLHPTTQVEAAEQLGWRTEIRPIHTFER
ncbi:MAG: hypothetical protein HYV95_16110 [Opitutae bacterium]|nr:hypothetical protein [Opitutae bacterium]